MKIAGMLLLISTLMGFKAHAQNYEVREFYNGIRALGMGGAGIAVVNDETSLLTNPAGLGKLREFYGTVIDPQIEGSSNFLQVYKTGNPFEPSEIYSQLSSKPDTNYHASGMIFPSLVFKNFGIGFFYRNSLDAKVDATGANMQTYYLNDMGLVLGYNLRLWDGRIKIGVTGKAISREEINKNLDTTTDMSASANASEGAAVGADVGLTLAAPWTWLPTLSAVVRDVGGTNFEAGSGLRMSTSERPAKLEQDIDVAVALFPIISNNTRSSFTLQYDKLKEASEATDKTRYMHAGYEINYSDLLFFRVGMNQKFWTAGVELASEYTQIQLASYGEEIGPDGGDSVEDRRFVFKFSFRF